MRDRFKCYDSFFILSFLITNVVISRVCLNGFELFVVLRFDLITDRLSGEILAVGSAFESRCLGDGVDPVRCRYVRVKSLPYEPVDRVCNVNSTDEQEGRRMI